MEQPNCVCSSGVCFYLTVVAVHSEHEVGASLSGARNYGRSSHSERTCRGVREEEADHKGIFTEVIVMA